MPAPAPPPQIFDRALVNRRLDRAWANAQTGGGADFLLARAAEELVERLSIVKRRFAVAADFGFVVGKLRIGIESVPVQLVESLLHVGNA